MTCRGKVGTPVLAVPQAVIFRSTSRCRIFVERLLGLCGDQTSSRSCYYPDNPVAFRRRRGKTVCPPATAMFLNHEAIANSNGRPHPDGEPARYAIACSLQKAERKVRGGKTTCETTYLSSENNPQTHDSSFGNHSLSPHPYVRKRSRHPLPS